MTRLLGGHFKISKCLICSTNQHTVCKVPSGPVTCTVHVYLETSTIGRIILEKVRMSFVGSTVAIM